MKASVLSFQAAVLFLVVGMVWGLVMAISNDHSAMPAHAHLILLGWVSLFLFGIYYRLNPWLEGARMANAQVWAWIIGTVNSRDRCRACANRPRSGGPGGCRWLNRRFG
jgi:hypothetical protein